MLDTGKPIWEARYDIQGCADTIQYYGGLAPSLVGTYQTAFLQEFCLFIE